MTTPAREVVVGVRMTLEDRERARKAAELLGLNVSTFVRQATLEKARRVLEKGRARDV